jgi:MFS family permease
MQTLTSFRSFDRPLQVLLVNMLANNIGFYMLIPFLAGYMANGLGLALWIVGLVIGIRSLSQQGASLVGGSIGDRLGYKQAIVAGSILRTVAFALFGFVDGPIGMAVGAILTGFGGALLSPAAKAYVAQESGPRRVEAFALLDVTLHGGTLLGPIVGSLLIGFDFRLVCFGAAAMFGLVTFLQLRYLPAREAEVSSGGGQSMLRSWGEPLRNRPFVLFALSILGFFFLYNQVYLGLPLEVERMTGSGVGVGLLFTMLAIVGIFGQVPISAMANARLRPATAIALGLLLMGLAFVPLLLTAAILPFGTAATAEWFTAIDLVAPPLLLDALTLAVNIGPLALCCLLLVAGQLLASPFISSTIATLSGGRLVGTYFGMYALVQGLGATFGNLVGGAAFDISRASGSPGLPWALMVAVGLACAAGLVGLDRSRLLTARSAGASQGRTAELRELSPWGPAASSASPTRPR